MSRKLQPVGTLLGKSSPLKHLRLELTVQARIIRELGAALPAELVPHLIAARIKGGELVLYTDAAAWATRLRYLAPEVLRASRPIAPGVQSLTVRISMPRRPPPRLAVRPLSTEAAAVIADAGAATTDEALRAALLRLAERGRR